MPFDFEENSGDGMAIAMTVHQHLPPGRYRLRVQDYEELAVAGAFRGARTELIKGEIFVMSPQFRPHGMIKMGLYDELRDALRVMRSPLRPVVESSLDLADDSMPDPEIMLISEPRGAKAVPLASVALIIEVADSSLADDLGSKLRLYAAAGIPEYWVADVNGRAIHKLWGPSGDAYKERCRVDFGEPIAAATIEGLLIETSSL